MNKKSYNFSSQKIPIIICIDVEPDGMFIDRTRKLPWIGYEKTSSFFNEIRPKLTSATGSKVNYSWFYRMDPQISDTYGSGTWPVLYYSEYVNEFINHNDEIGIHTHFYRFNERNNDWIIDNNNVEWMSHCITSSYKAFKEAFNRTSFSHRFGDRIINDTALTIVKSMGSRFDLTPEPGFKEIPPDFIKKRITGQLPEMTDIPQEPYIHCSADLNESDSNKGDFLWLIPLSTGKIRPNICRLFGLNQSLTLHLGTKPRFFRSITKKRLKALHKPYLGLVLKTDMVLDQHLFKNIKNNLTHLMTHPYTKRFVFATPEETMKMLDFI